MTKEGQRTIAPSVPAPMTASPIARTRASKSTVRSMSRPPSFQAQGATPYRRDHLGRFPLSPPEPFAPAVDHAQRSDLRSPFTRRACARRG